MTETRDDTADPLIGQLITGRYRVQARIGEGGMGTVYVALHEAIEKPIALKILHREYSTNPEVVERFQQEAISASRIKHPNVIDVFDFGQLDDGSCFIAMELLEGQDLGHLLSQKGALPPEEAVRICLQVARALGLAHTRGVVHRDLKPENVFLQRTPEDPRVVKIVDFGIAQLRKEEEPAPDEPRRRRLTKTGMIFGTPEYMAPEQARGQTVDQRTDIYASGVILYEILTGVVPFTGESFLEVLNQHVLDPLPKLTEKRPSLVVSAELEQVVTVALAKSPLDRFPTMKHLAQALLRTPEGRALQKKVHGEGMSAEQLTDELLSGAPPNDGERRSRSVQTISGVPALEDRWPNAPASEDRTPPGRLLERVPQARRSPLPLVFALLTAVLLAGGVFAWRKVALEQRAVAASSSDLTPSGSDRNAMALPGAGPAPAAPAAAEDLPGSGGGSARAEPRPTEDARADRTEAAEPSHPVGVLLHIVTVPEGAVIHKGEFQVCDASPCDLLVAPEEAVVLRASKGTMTGVARVQAQQEQKVFIPLRAAPKKTKSGASEPAVAKKPGTCEVMVDGLKILRPCE